MSMPANVLRELAGLFIALGMVVWFQWPHSPLTAPVRSR